MATSGSAFVASIHFKIASSINFIRYYDFTSNYLHCMIHFWWIPEKNDERKASHYHHTLKKVLLLLIGMRTLFSKSHSIGFVIAWISFLFE